MHVDEERLRSQADMTLYLPPRCPHCRGARVQEWGRVDIAYPVVGLDPETDDVDTGDAAGDVNFDTYRFDELCCRDCGFSSSDVSVFLP